MKSILFITGNPDKLREFREMLKDVTLEHKDVDLPELQGEPEEIAKEKAKLAAKLTGQTCIVEDTCLSFDAWQGLPGPYIKHFIKKLGAARTAEILHASSDNHKARAMTTIGYCEPGKEPVCIAGMTEGKILSARGTKNFLKGWDQIFSPTGDQRTFAEMEPEEKHSFSQRGKAINAFKRFLLQSDN
ncbi:TPA: non-canonical purine NTP pyrophosphatase [Candidatus Woesearchaeota archaeon]|nr:non-canonical purine NTP pyrophosphatase [Candidatus Woesearchaeota archaeon]